MWLCNWSTNWKDGIFHDVRFFTTLNFGLFFGGDRIRPISTSASSFFRVRPIRLRPISTSANFDFGQFRQFRLRPIRMFGQFLDVEFLDHKRWGPEGWRPKPRKRWAPKPGAPKGGARRVGPEGWGAQKGGEPRRVEPRRVEPREPKWGIPERWSPEGWGPKFFCFFFVRRRVLRHKIFFLLSLSWGPCVEFWWCLKRRGPEMWPISTSANFGPISISANSISASWPKSNCPKSNWSKSSIFFFCPLPFFKMSGFNPTRNFGQFWADPHFFSREEHFFGRREGPQS